jgi:hypothetical protein
VMNDAATEWRKSRAYFAGHHELAFP